MKYAIIYALHATHSRAAAHIRSPAIKGYQKKKTVLNAFEVRFCARRIHAGINFPRQNVRIPSFCTNLTATPGARPYTLIDALPAAIIFFHTPRSQPLTLSLSLPLPTNPGRRRYLRALTVRSLRSSRFGTLTRSSENQILRLYIGTYTYVY